MEDQNVFDDIKDIVSVVGINFVGLAISLSEAEQILRICSAAAVCVYTVLKIAKMLRK
jgi:hypothetical protein